MAESTPNTFAGRAAATTAVLPMKPAPAKAAPKNSLAPSGRRVQHTNRALRRQATAAATNGVVGLGLMMLTLTHSAHGTMIVTGCDTWEAWAMSAGIDLAYVTLKLTLLTASDRVRRQVGSIAEWAIVGTLIGSAAMNIFAFTSGATSIYAMVAGALMGAAIPELLYVVTQVGAAAWIDYGRA